MEKIKNPNTLENIRLDEIESLLKEGRTAAARGLAVLLYDKLRGVPKEIDSAITQAREITTTEWRNEQDSIQKTLARLSEILQTTA